MPRGYGSLRDVALLGTRDHEAGAHRPADPANLREAFVKRHKNDAADAEAIAEAASRPTMRFVAVKSEEQQARAMIFRARDLLVRQRTQLINALRVIWPNSASWWRRVPSISRS
ncbi:transposase [Mesorhizobium sp. M2D.F.Ca.ET.178.01.1.1]|nr:MAG: transposase [Mesorhizobium sp.]TGS90185.1 transposase [Mesorhizobium sp. M2D.F.Ca.ET.178.01.1.1]